jgi:hypothetical protein
VAVDGRSAAQDGRTAGLPVRIALGAPLAGSLIGSSEGSAAQSSGVSFDLLAWGKTFFGPAEHRRKGKEDITFDLLLCAAVGGSVALMVSIGRLWRRGRRAA